MADVTAEDIMAAARMRVYQRHPYMSAVLFQVRLVARPGLGTLAVDGGWRMYYDPEQVLTWHREEEQGKLDRIAGDKDAGHDGVAGVVFHEIGHLLRDHAHRLVGKDAVRANEAQDREINDDVVAAGWRLPDTPLLPDDLGMHSGLTCEEYYEEPDPGKGPGPGCTLWAPGCGGACGSAAQNPVPGEGDGEEGGDPRGESAGGEADSSSGPAPAPVSPLEQEIALRRAALATLQHARSRGTVPAGLRAWAQARLRPAKVDWRRRLAGLTRRALASVAGASDFTWRKSGRRSLYAAGRAGWPIAPALHQPLPVVAVVLDTSGSMSETGSDGERTVLEEALAEVLGLVLAAGGQAWGYACDADVHAEVRLASPADLNRLNKGGGGTDMRPGFAAARKRRPDVVVIVTDGLVGDGWPGPEDCRGVRVLACLCGGYGARTPAHIPSVEVTP